MDEGGRRIQSDERREQLYRAKRSGAVCAGCGRTFGPEEAIYMERLLLGARRLRGSHVVTYASDAYAPVGSECASSDLLERTAGTVPERCAGCGRGVYYHPRRPPRRRALCSKRCTARAATAQRMARARMED